MIARCASEPPVFNDAESLDPLCKNLGEADHTRIPQHEVARCIAGSCARGERAQLHPERWRLAELLSGHTIRAGAGLAAGGCDPVEIRLAEYAFRLCRRGGGLTIGVGALEQLQYLSHLRFPSLCLPLESGSGF